MTPAERFLSRVEGVKQTGRGRWVFRTPTREDRRASGSARELDDGRLLIHDFGGDSVVDILAAIDLNVSDLFPERAVGHRVGPERRPFPAADVLRAVGLEAMVVAASAVTLLSGQPFSEVDRERLILAASRIQAALIASGVSHYG